MHSRIPRAIAGYVFTLALAAAPKAALPSRVPRLVKAAPTRRSTWRATGASTNATDKKATPLRVTASGAKPLRPDTRPVISVATAPAATKNSGGQSQGSPELVTLRPVISVVTAPAAAINAGGQSQGSPELAALRPERKVHFIEGFVSSLRYYKPEPRQKVPKSPRPRESKWKLLGSDFISTRRNTYANKGPLPLQHDPKLHSIYTKFGTLYERRTVDVDDDSDSSAVPEVEVEEEVEVKPPLRKRRRRKAGLWTTSMLEVERGAALECALSRPPTLDEDR